MTTTTNLRKLSSPSLSSRKEKSVPLRSKTSEMFSSKCSTISKPNLRNLMPLTTTWIDFFKKLMILSIEISSPDLMKLTKRERSWMLNLMTSLIRGMSSLRSCNCTRILLLRPSKPPDKIPTCLRSSTNCKRRPVKSPGISKMLTKPTMISRKRELKSRPSLMTSRGTPTKPSPALLTRS